jgi:hypothetical protein
MESNKNFESIHENIKSLKNTEEIMIVLFAHLNDQIVPMQSKRITTQPDNSPNSNEGISDHQEGGNLKNPNLTASKSPPPKTIHYDQKRIVH